MSEGVRGQATERRMGLGFIVISPPLFNPLPGIGHREEPLCVQAFGPQAAVERLNVGTIRGRSGSGEVDLHPVQIRPLVQHSVGKSWAIVHPQALRPAAAPGDLIERLHHLIGPETYSRHYRQ
jgi:hypothetical protein